MASASHSSAVRVQEGGEFVLVLSPEFSIVHQPVWLQITLRRPCLECAGRFEKATHEAWCSRFSRTMAPSRH